MTAGREHSLTRYVMAFVSSVVLAGLAIVWYVLWKRGETTDIGTISALLGQAFVALAIRYSVSSAPSLKKAILLTVVAAALLAFVALVDKGDNSSEVGLLILLLTIGFIAHSFELGIRIWNQLNSRVSRE